MNNNEHPAGTAVQKTTEAEVTTSSPTCCNTPVGGSYRHFECDENYKSPKYSFKDGKCFKDEKYFGKVIFSDDKIIQIEVDNGNRYMQGQITTFQIVRS